MKACHTSEFEMNNRTKYILAAFAVVALVSNIMFSTKARAPKPIDRIGSDFYENLPADVIRLRTDFEKETLVYEEMMRPYNAQLEELAEDKLSAEEAEKLLTEVELKTGKQEAKVNDLRQDLNARMKELRQAHQAKRRKQRG